MTESTRKPRSWKCAPTCPICGKPNPPKRQTCSDECKRERKRRRDRETWATDPVRRKQILDAQDRRAAREPGFKQAYDAAYRELTRERRLELKRIDSARRYRLDIEASRRASRLRAAKRRALKLGNGSFDVLERDLRRALNRARNRCAACEGAFTEENPLQWDHVIPITRGGRHSIGNLQPLCRGCNLGKMRRFLMEWRVGRVVPGVRKAA